MQLYSRCKIPENIKVQFKVINANNLCPIWFVSKNKKTLFKKLHVTI